MRHETLQTIYNFIDNKLNLLNNTYFIYTSDHGFHIGLFGMGWDQCFGNYFKPNVARHPFNAIATSIFCWLYKNNLKKISLQRETVCLPL